MTICTVWFLPKEIENQERWITLLREWLIRAQSGASESRRILILDGRDKSGCAIGGEFAKAFGADVFYGQTGVYPEIAGGYPGRENEFMRRDELLLSVLHQLPDDTLYLDCDAWINRDPSNCLDGDPVLSMAMGISSGDGLIPGTLFTMRGAGVMLFGRHEYRSKIVQDFLRTFSEMKRLQLELQFFEQSAWSVVNKLHGDRTLPREMNWFPFLPSYGENWEACVHHWHGRWKWHKLGYGDPESIPRILQKPTGQ